MKAIYNFLKYVYYKLKYMRIGTKIKTTNIGRNVKFRKNCIINKRTHIGKNSEIGDFTYFNTGPSFISVGESTSIGKFCSIGPGVYIGIGNHEMKFLTTHPIISDKLYRKKFNNKIIEQHNINTIIGNDVWIGANAIILKGKKVGNGAIIGARSSCY